MIWSCLPVCLFSKIISGNMSVRDWACAARDMGFDAIDMSVLFIPQRTPASIGKLRRDLSESGIPVAMMTTYPDFTQPDEQLRSHQLAHAISDIAIASELEIQYLRITAGQMHQGLSDSEGVKLAVEGIAECSKFASRWGVKLLLENHSKPGAWELPDFDFHTGHFLKLVDALAGLPVCINFDTANTYALGDDAVAVFQEVYPRVASIHVNDIRDCEALEFVGVGDGTAPIRQIFEVAKQRGFDGLMSIEEAGHEGLTGIRRSLERAKEMWQQA